MRIPILLSLVAACFASGAGAQTPYDGHQVVRVHPADFRQLRAAMTIANDVWTHSPAVGRPLDLQVDAERLATLRRAGLDPVVTIADVGALVTAERVRLEAAAQAGGVAGGAAWFEEFKDLAAIYAKLDEFVAQRPDLVTPVEVGTSLEGRPIRGVRISSAGADSPAILFNGCQHAREWISPMTVMYIANELVDGASTDEQVAGFVSTFEIYVIPVVNPDGYQYSWDAVRLWRKNRRDNGDGNFGVDLNRNWSFEWGGAGSSGSTSSETYRGPAPFSEPESAALRDFYLARPNLIASIDFHSFGQLVLSPWGWTAQSPPDDPLFAALTGGVADAILASTGMEYTPGPIGSTLYLASGNIVDWAYGDRNALSFTIELRDTGETGFILPPGEIIPTGVETMAAMRGFLSDLTAPASVLVVGGAPAQVDTGTTTTVDVRIRDLAETTIMGSETLWWRESGSEKFVQQPLVPDGDDPNGWLGLLPQADCGDSIEWYVEAATASALVRSPIDAPKTLFTTAYQSSDTVLVDDLEVGSGWTVGAPGDTATSGIWTLVDPNGTSAQPEHDSSADGVTCFVTGQGPPGGADGIADVDNGATTLTSPPLDCAHPESHVQYDRWYSNNLGNAPNSDSMPIEISSDGATWVELELVTENANAWVTRSFRVADFVAPSATVRVRFVARDLNAGSLVEAGVDELRVLVVACPDALGDLDGDGAVGGGDLAILLGLWGSADASGDLDGSGVVDGGDLAILLGSWG